LLFWGSDMKKSEKKLYFFLKWVLTIVFKCSRIGIARIISEIICGSRRTFYVD
jgi:hypothetical protein